MLATTPLENCRATRGVGRRRGSGDGGGGGGGRLARRERDGGLKRGIHTVEEAKEQAYQPGINKIPRAEW